MSPRIVITGTDTEIGKTVLAAALTQALGAHYWKPVQSGLDEETDSETVARLAGAPRERVLREVWRLRTPASPHLAARLDGVRIDPGALEPPAVDGPLVIEGAGGLLVPLTETTLYVDVFARWGLPVVLCARTALGGINHGLLSLEALRRRGVPVLGVAFLGAPAPDTEEIVCRLGETRRLGRLPRLDPLTPETLAAAFAENFQIDDFTKASGP